MPLLSYPSRQSQEGPFYIYVFFTRNFEEWHIEIIGQL
jgi:hypothetical protein